MRILGGSFLALLHLLLVQILVSLNCQVNADKIIAKENNISGTLKYTCSASGKTGDVMSWYQKKGSDHILLKRTRYIQDKEITLRVTKPLELSDNDTEIYCAKQTELPGGGLTEGIQTNKTLIRIKEEHIKYQNKPIFVTVTPNTSPVSFSINESLSFVCNGTTPTDAMTLNWYIRVRGKETKPAENQCLNITEYTNNLELLMDPSYHQKQLYCTQELQYYNLQPDGSFGKPKYREVARSKMILLQQKGIEENTGEPEYDTRRKPPSNNLTSPALRVLSPDNIKQGHTSNAKSSFSLTLLIILSASAAAILLILLVTEWCQCHRKAPPLNKKEEEDIYTTPQVTYAELNLQSNNTEYATIPGRDESPYARIVGVLNLTRR